MKVLIEGYSYDPAVVKNILPESRFLLTDKKAKIENVGYYRNPECDDFVFFLPKVLLEPVKMSDGSEEDRVFCRKDEQGHVVESLRPEDIIDLSAGDDGAPGKLTKEQADFLYEFSVWIYRAIAHYEEHHKGTDAVRKLEEIQSGAFRRKYVTNTLLDVILAMQRFNRENQDYFLFKIKEKHSGANKINWTRTISKSTALVRENAVLYLEPRSKKRMVDYDEELLVIFYSILDHIRKRYGFRVKINMGYELISEGKFERYLAGYGETRLRQIKYKYFSDRDLALWELCFAFFNKAHKANVVSDREEYLLAKNFEIIFESMVDELIGDSEMARFKELKDGKEIDHLYIDESLTRRVGAAEKTFYIADSKYYKLGNSLSDESVAKQFTYARDMLQLNLDLFLSGPEASDAVKRRRKPFEESGMKRSLRDDDTEGYDVIPNFFISAVMDPGFDYDDPRLELRGEENGREFRNIHFENRLFDRDTLILSHYNVNFLYVLKLYAQNDTSEQATWRNKVRDEFRRQIRHILSNRFRFYAMMPHPGTDVRAFFRENFRYTLGKVYAPYPPMEDGTPIYSLALEDESNLLNDKGLSPDGMLRRKECIAKENGAVDSLLKSAFYVVEAKLGEKMEDIREKLMAAAAHPVEGGFVSRTESIVRNSVLYGTFSGKKHLEWMLKQKKYNLPIRSASGVGIDTDEDARQRFMLYLMPPSRSHGEDTRLFKIKFIKMVSREVLKNDFEYYKEPKHDWYWLWEAELISEPMMDSEEPVEGAV